MSGSIRSLMPYIPGEQNLCALRSSKTGSWVTNNS